MTCDCAGTARPSFDLVISISNFEHDGLGRYGDPVDPGGDLRAMAEMRALVKPGGILILGVPVARDAVVWNAHRLYGRVRLPLLLRGWSIDAFVGFDGQVRQRARASVNQQLLLTQQAGAGLRGRRGRLGRRARARVQEPRDGN
jgi:SAM-dependent methyltransferase